MISWWLLAGGGAIGLIAVAFVLKQIKWAIIAGCLIGAAVLGQRVYHAGYTARVAEDVLEQTKVLRDRIAAMEAAQQADAERADQDQQKIAELERAANETPKNDTVCLDRAARDRVQHIRDGAAQGAAPDNQPTPKPPSRFKEMFRFKRSSTP